MYMKNIVKIGIVTYESLHCNFTNYGTVLQAWALEQVLQQLEVGYPKVINLIDYCPLSMNDKDPLNPMGNMWDCNEEARKMCEELLPKIKQNFAKIKDFYKHNCNLTERSYQLDNFDEIENEQFDLFICGSDSIWDFTEFGIDDVYWANKKVMKCKSLAYAPSFQDSYFQFSPEDKAKILELIMNFSCVGLRDSEPIEDIKKKKDCIIQRVVDPTLLLTQEDYVEITADRLVKEDYLLYYSRRFNSVMEKYVDEMADRLGLKVVEISIRTTNKYRHILYYSAGVEEFLSLVKYSSFVITNSFHCSIFAMHFKKEFYVFGREHCNYKIKELLSIVGLSNRFVIDSIGNVEAINYDDVQKQLKGSDR